MIESIQAQLAQMSGFEVRAAFYQAGAAPTGKVIYIEPHDTSAEIKSGINPTYPETLYFKIIIAVPSKGNVDAPKQLIEAVRSVRAKFWAGERAPDKVTWLKCFSFKEYESCKFVRPEPNETKALAVLSLEIKSIVAL